MEERFDVVTSLPRPPGETYVCSGCGYGIRVAGPQLPPCPMCRAERWRAESTETHHAE